jgi:putative endonuclease
MPLHNKKKTYDRGINAEKAASFWLQLKGYKILERRYKTTFSEIYLIVRYKDVIAFVEVKARSSKIEALESITPNMKRRIENAARYYISHNDFTNYNMRFDVVAVTPIKLANFKAGQFFIHHLDNAWQATA